jgi:hypothetical protein
MKKSIEKFFAILVCMSLMIQLSNAQNSFSGTVLYHDDISLPVGNATVTVKDAQGTIIGSTTTGPDGTYSFENIPDGNYRLIGSTSAPTGGVTLYDATLVILHILLPSYYPFTPLQELAADVNGSGTITLSDYFLILRNYLTYGQSFPVGNWVFADQPFSLSGLKDAPPHLGGSSAGDISGVFVPGTRSLAALILDEDASLSVDAASSFDVSLSSKDILQLNGAGIILNYSGDLLKVEAATCKSDDYYVNITENQVRINWIKTDGNPIEFAANEPIVTLTCRAKDNFTEGMSTHFILDPATSIVNKDNEEMNSFKFAMPLVERGKATINLGNYPNPFVGSTAISYGIAAEGNVRLEILSQTGQTLKVLNIGYQTAGNHSYSLEANDLKPGIYFYRLSVTGASTFIQTKQMIISN